MNKDFEIMFETGVDEMSWDDTVSLADPPQPSSLHYGGCLFVCLLFVCLFVCLGELSYGWVLQVAQRAGGGEIPASSPQGYPGSHRHCPSEDASHSRRSTGELTMLGCTGKH